MAIRNEDHKDLTLFKNRLYKLMEENKYGAARALATDLYDKGLVHVKSHPSEGTSDADIRKNAIGSIEKKIIRHLHAPNAKDVQGEFILAYCSHFSCSADYLFGYTTIKTNNYSIRNACETTGLTENSTNNIMKITKEIEPEEVLNNLFEGKYGFLADEKTEILNTLLSSDRFIALCEHLFHLAAMIDVWNKSKEETQALLNELGVKNFSEALEHNYDAAKLYKITEPEPEEKDKYELFYKIIETVGEENRNNLAVKVARYELNETFENLIEELYPR